MALAGESLAVGMVQRDIRWVAASGGLTDRDLRLMAPTAGSGRVRRLSSEIVRPNRDDSPMPVLPCWVTTFLTVAIGAFVLSGCGGTRAVRPKAIAFEPTIIGCSRPAECTSGNDVLLRESREARNHLCPEDKPDVLIKANGILVCVAMLPSAGPTEIGLSTPSSVRAQGLSAITYFKAGEAIAARTGCLACHRIGQAGNPGPGSDLTRVGARLLSAAIERALVYSPAPMPSFSHLPDSQRRALVDFLAQLR